jgi:hypothetical protein
MGYKNKVLANRLDWKNFQITAKFKQISASPQTGCL